MVDGLVVMVMVILILTGGILGGARVGDRTILGIY